MVQNPPTYKKFNQLSLFAHKTVKVAFSIEFTAPDQPSPLPSANAPTFDLYQIILTSPHSDYFLCALPERPRSGSEKVEISSRWNVSIMVVRVLQEWHVRNGTLAIRFCICFANTRLFLSVIFHRYCTESILSLLDM